MVIKLPALAPPDVSDSSTLFTPVEIRPTSALAVYKAYEPLMEWVFNYLLPFEDDLPSFTSIVAASKPTPSSFYSNKIIATNSLCVCRTYK